LNRPIRVFGFPPKALTTIFMALAVAILSPIPKLALPFLLGLALWLTHRLARDPVGLKIWWRAFFQRARYLPTKREVFRMEIRK
jgi:hypothetical protein